MPIYRYERFKETCHKLKHEMRVMVLRDYQTKTHGDRTHTGSKSRNALEPSLWHTRGQITWERPVHNVRRENLKRNVIWNKGYEQNDKWANISNFKWDQTECKYVESDYVTQNRYISIPPLRNRPHDCSNIQIQVLTKCIFQTTSKKEWMTILHRCSSQRSA